jgi:hypothetical protein
VKDDLPKLAAAAAANSAGVTVLVDKPIGEQAPVIEAIAAAIAAAR